MTAPRAAAVALAAWVGWAPTSREPARAQAVDERAMCSAASATSLTDAAKGLATYGDAGRDALMRLSTSTTPGDILCGIQGLAALRDPRVADAVHAVWRRPALQDDAYRLARWAAYVAGGPDASLGARFAVLVGDLDDPALWRAVGDDGPRLLGEIDHASARDRLVAELERPQSATTLDNIVHALARQGDARARDRVRSLGDEVATTLSTNPTAEQRSRIGTAAFFHLALDDDARAVGLRLLRLLPRADQEDTAAWAVQTLCERAVRRPTDAPTLRATRVALIDDLSGLGVRWNHLARGNFPCPQP